MPKSIDIKKKWMKRLNLYGLADEDFDLIKEKLSKRFNKDASDGDVIWGLFQKLATGTTDLQKLKGLYYEKALFLNDEGRDCFSQLQQSAKIELHYLKKDGSADKVEICSTGGCKACKKLDGKIFTIKEALDKMPIPCRECSYKFRIKDNFGFCRCEYVPVYYEEGFSENNKIHYNSALTNQKTKKIKKSDLMAVLKIIFYIINTILVIIGFLFKTLTKLTAKKRR